MLGNQHVWKNGDNLKQAKFIHIAKSCLIILFYAKNDNTQQFVFESFIDNMNFLNEYLSKLSNEN